MGGPRALATAALYLVLLSNGQIRGKNLRNGTLPGAKNHPQRLGFPSSEKDSLGLFTHRPQTPQRSFQGTAAGTHLPSPTGSHTADHRAKQGRFRWGCYLYPRTVLCGSETLRGRMAERCTLPLLGLGRVCSRRVQRACGTAMCLCASLFRRRRGPAGLRDPIAVSLHRGTPRFWPTVITECREKHTSFLCTELFCQLCLRLPPLCCTL